MTKTRTCCLSRISLLVLMFLECLTAPSAAAQGDIRTTLAVFADGTSGLTVTWGASFPDTNYTSVCTAETAPSDFLLPVITSRTAGSMNVVPTDSSGGGTLHCLAIPDSDSSDIRHTRAAFTGHPSSVDVAWSPAFTDTNYTAVCTVETPDNPGSGFTSVINAVNPGSISVINGGFDSGTMHCIAIPDSDSSAIRRSRVAVSGSPSTVTIPWNQPFQNQSYAAVCSDEVDGASGSDSAIAIYSGSKLPGSIVVIPEIVSGTVHCVAAAANAQAVYSFVGVPFNQFTNTSCPPTCKISGSFILSQALPPNWVGNIGGSGDFMPLSFSFTDGETVITDLNSQSSGFAVNTDSNGNITLFSFFMSGPGGGSGIYAYCGGPGTLTQEGINIDAYQAMFEGLGAPCGTWTTSPGLRFVPATPCRVVDTRNPNGEFGGPPIPGGTYRTFPIPQGVCNIPADAAAYSLNVTLVPIQNAPVAYLTIWPTGQNQPVVSTMNSLDGRIKANAAIVPAGTSGADSVFVTNTANVVLDIDGYFTAPTAQTSQFYPLTPCRVLDTRKPNGDLGGPYLQGGQERDFPVLESTCNIPDSAQAYSLNWTVVPYNGQSLGYLTVWPKGEPQPLVSTLNNLTGTIVANAAIVPAGTGGAIAVYPSSNTELVADIDGYFAPAGQGGLSLYPTVPCRVIDTRKIGNGQPFSGTLSPPVDAVDSVCAIPITAQAYAFNATVVPVGSLGYITLWPDSEGQPVVSTLNAIDGAITSNMAIVPNVNGRIDAYASGLTQLILDISSFFAP